MIAVRHLYISPGHNFFGRHGQPAGAHPILEVPQVECVAGHGLRGDRFFDYKLNYKGQVTFFALEVFHDLGQSLAVTDKSPAVFRRNVITEGADLPGLIGQEFEVQGVRFRSTEECSPCHWMDAAFAPGTEKLMQGCGGLRAVILTDGLLRVESA